MEITDIICSVSLFLLIARAKSDCFEYVKGIPHYKGKINVTKSGFSCQRWDTNYPHVVMYTPSHFSENYCRNPSNDGFIWCYTVSTTTRWERCDIEACLNTSESITTIATTLQLIGNENTSHMACSCICADRQMFWLNFFNGNLTKEEKEMIIVAEKVRIQKALSIDRSKLSSTWRRKRSAADNRPSAVSMGFVGVAVILTVIVLIVLGDITRFCRTKTVINAKQFF